MDKQVDILIGQDNGKYHLKSMIESEIGVGSGAFINAMNHLNEERAPFVWNRLLHEFDTDLSG